MAARIVILSLFTLFSLAYSAKDEYAVTEEVYFDVEIKNYEKNEDYRGRFVVGVFGDICPVTALNFISLAEGFKRSGKQKLHYKNTPVHKVVKDFVIQMGDVSKKDGTGEISIYGGTFADENFVVSHQSAGIVSMANHGKDSNGSQFFVLLTKSRWLDQKHVAFGKVVKGMDVVRLIGELETKSDNKPFKPVKIVDSGVVGLERKYFLNETQMQSDDDLF